MNSKPTRRILAIFVMIVASALSDAEEFSNYQIVRGPETDGSRVNSFLLSSDYLGGESRIQILYPQNPTNRILFLLPVTPWPGFEDKWERLGSGMAEILKHDYHNQHGYTVVIPDFPDYMPWFIDHDTDPNRRHESYMLNVVVPFIDAQLHMENPVRDLVGFSKGGFGSLSLLLRHPTIFNAAAVWDPGGVTKPYDATNRNSLSFAAGSLEQFTQYQLKQSAKRNATHFRGEPRIAIAGYSNDNFLNQLRSLRELLERHRVPHLYSESIQVPHRWHTGWLGHSLQSLREMRD